MPTKTCRQKKIYMNPFSFLRKGIIFVGHQNGSPLWEGYYSIRIGFFRFSFSFLGTLIERIPSAYFALMLLSSISGR